LKIIFDCKLSDNAKKELKRAAKFYAKELMDHAVTQNLELEIAVVNKLPMQGLCEVLDDERKPSLFRIELRKELAGEVLSSLAHEMVHVKQYATGELRDTAKENIIVWQGKKLNVKNLISFDHPWEVEAYGKEVGLIWKYAKKYPGNIINPLKNIG